MYLPEGEFPHEETDNANTMSKGDGGEKEGEERRNAAMNVLFQVQHSLLLQLPALVDVVHSTANILEQIGKSHKI